MAREGGLVLPHERRLADGRRGLLLRDRARPLGEPEARHAGRDGARGDQHHAAPLAHGGDLRGERLDAVWRDAGAGLGHQTGPDLDDQAPDAA